MLKQSLTYHLVSLAEDGIGMADGLFEQRFGLNVHELRVLRIVAATPGITFTQLAAETKFERSATSRILSRLIKAGLIQRRNASNDARRFELFATAKGEALRARAKPLSLELEQLMLSPLSATEQHSFLAMLGRLRDWVATGYIEELVRRYPAVAKPRRKRPGKAAGAGRRES